MFETSLNSFGQTRARTLALVRNLSQREMDYTPVPGKWSVGEVLDHLLLSERYFRSEIKQLIELRRAGREAVLQRGFRDLNISIAFFPKSLLSFFEVPITLFSQFIPRPLQEFALRSRLIPAQHPDVATPRKGRPVRQLQEDLASSFQETRTLFETNADIDYRALVHQHPLLGSNNVLQLLRILTLHEQRHQGQITDLLAAMPWGQKAQFGEALAGAR